MNSYSHWMCHYGNYLCSCGFEYCEQALQGMIAINCVTKTLKMFIITLWKFTTSWCFVFPSGHFTHNHDARVTQYLRCVCTVKSTRAWIALKIHWRWMASPMSIESWILVAVGRMVFRVGICLELNNTIDHSPLKLLIFEIHFRINRSVAIWISILWTGIDAHINNYFDNQY